MPHDRPGTQMGCFVVAEFLLTTASCSPSAIAEFLVTTGCANKKTIPWKNIAVFKAR